MADHPNPVALALADHIGRELEVVLNGYLLTAQAVMDMTDVAFVMHKIAANVARGALLFSVEARVHDVTGEEMFDLALRCHHQTLSDSRSQVLAVATQRAVHGMWGG